MRTKIVLLLLTVGVTTAHTQWLDPQSLQSTVLIEKSLDTTFVTFGTGVVLWNYFDTRYPIVVTAGHLLNRDEIFVSINADSSFVKRMRGQRLDSIQFDTQRWILSGNRFRARVRLNSNNPKTFIVDKANDLGFFLIDLPTRVVQDGDTLQVSKLKSISSSMIRKRDYLSLGDECYFIGFPFGLGTEINLEPIVRSGSVASYSKQSWSFLLDAFSFGGNSGSPVFTKVLLGRQPGLLNWEQSFFVGIVTGHLGEGSQNVGLAVGTWADAILELTRRAPEIVISD